MIPPVPETPQLMTLDDWLNYLEGSLRGDSSAPVQHLRAEIHKAFRTAQREAAERGFYAGITANRQYMPGTFTTSKEQWESSALKAELEQPT